MRSIPLAFTWELLYRGNWRLVGAALGANVLPFMILSALRSEGPLDPADPSMLMMQIVLSQINMLIFASALFAAQGQPSRLYAYPIANASIVTWHFLPAMVLMVLESLASTAATNAVFELDWPLWGPAFLAAVALAAVQAALWLTEKTTWIVWGLTLVATVLGLWFKSRYGAMFSLPSHQWREVTFLDAATLVTMGGIAYYAAVVGVARSRRGDALPALGIMAWIERMLDDSAPAFGRPFRSPAEAQSWFEWRKKGWAMPAIVLFGMFLGVGCWLIFNRDLSELLGAFAIGGGLLSVGAMVVGLLMGNLGRDDAHFEIGSFLSTRPMTTTEMARMILKTAAQSVFVAWALWAAVFSLLYLVLVPTSVISPPHELRDLQWWYWPATLLGPWTIVAVGTVMGLTGRERLWAALICSSFALWIGLILLTKYCLSPQQATVFMQGCTAILGVLCVLGTTWAFVAARRRSFIGWPTVGVATSVWAALATVVVAAWLFQPTVPLAVPVLIVGVLALAVSPLACAPLALAWNRNR